MLDTYIQENIIIPFAIMIPRNSLDHQLSIPLLPFPSSSPPPASLQAPSLSLHYSATHSDPRVCQYFPQSLRFISFAATPNKLVQDPLSASTNPPIHRSGAIKGLTNPGNSDFLSKLVLTCPGCTAETHASPSPHRPPAAHTSEGGGVEGHGGDVFAGAGGFLYAGG